MPQSSKNEYANLRTFGGLSLEYSALTEVDFTAPAGSAYTPPESGGYRRNNVSRCIQLLSDATGVIETFQTSSAELFLPANTITESTNDAGNGRLFFLKNSGTGTITVKNYLGTTLWFAIENGITIVVGNDNDNWDFYFSAENIPFSHPNFTSTNVKDAIAEAKQNAEGFPRAGLSLTVNGTVGNGNWITYSELLANPRILFPVKVRIKEITWVNNNVNLGAFDFEFYKNGQASGNKVFTYSAPAIDRTAGYGYYVWTTNLDFNAGDSLYIKNVRPSGTALSDLALIVWISRLP